MPKLDGVDTSNNQGPAVVYIGPQIVALGADLWMHKATEGTGFRDRYWPTQRQARVDVGLRYGGPYHWLRPNQSVQGQFDNFAGYVGDLWDGECIQLDIEDPAGLPDWMVFELIDLCEARWPGRILVYTGRYYMYDPPSRTYLIDRLIARYGDALKWWLPWYSNVYPGSQIPTTPVMWQWGGGKNGVVIEGVGQVDSNEAIDRVRLDKACGYGTHGSPGEGIPTPHPHPDDPDPDPPLDPDTQPGDDMATPIGFITVSPGTQGHHMDGSTWEADVDGTVFWVAPGGYIQWVHDPAELATKIAVLNAAAARIDFWDVRVADPDAFGLLAGEAPGRPAGWTPPTAVGSGLGGEADRQFLIAAFADTLADVSLEQDGTLKFHFNRA